MRVYIPRPQTHAFPTWKGSHTCPACRRDFCQYKIKNGVRHCPMCGEKIP